MRATYTAHRYQLSPTNRRATLERNGDARVAELKIRPEPSSESSLRTSSYQGETFSHIELQQLLEMLTDALADGPV